MAPGTEVALLATVQHAVEERCQALGAATVASLVKRLGAAGGEVFCQGFLTTRRGCGSWWEWAPRSVRADRRVEPRVVIASDELDELERIAQWCKARVERDPERAHIGRAAGRAGFA